jgi:LysM repeat protein
MTCYACDREPAQQCSRCGRPYCEDHGEDFCGVCLQPSSGVPSFTLYRGSLLALLVGTALAVWLIVQPTGGQTESALRPVVVTPTASSSAGRLTTPGPLTTPGAVTTPGAGTTVPTAAGTPAGGATQAASTPRPTGTTAPSGTATPGDYTVVSGDSLSAICEKITKPAGMTVPDCVDQIVKTNNLTSPNDISVGQKLKVPTR